MKYCPWANVSNKHKVKMPRLTVAWRRTSRLLALARLLMISTTYEGTFSPASYCITHPTATLINISQHPSVPHPFTDSQGEKNWPKSAKKKKGRKIWLFLLMLSLHPLCKRCTNCTNIINKQTKQINTYTIKDREMSTSWDSNQGFLCKQHAPMRLGMYCILKSI